MADTVADPVIKELPSEVPSSTAAPASDCVSKPADSATLSFKVQYGKDAADLKRPADSTVGELKADVEKTLGIPPAMQKLMFKGKNVQDDGVTLQQVRRARAICTPNSIVPAAATDPRSSMQTGRHQEWLQSASCGLQVIGFAFQPVPRDQHESYDVP